MDTYCRCPDLAARHQLVNMLRALVSRWLMQEETQRLRGYPGSGRWGCTSSKERGTILSCIGVLIVGGTSLCRRGREAPKSLGVLGFDWGKCQYQERWMAPGVSLLCGSSRRRGDDCWMRQFTYRKRTDRVAFPLEYSPKVYQSTEQVYYYA